MKIRMNVKTYIYADCKSIIAIGIINNINLDVVDKKEKIYEIDGNSYIFSIDI